MMNPWAILVFATAMAISSPAAKGEVLGQVIFDFNGESTNWLTQTREVRGKLRHSAKLEKRGFFDTVSVQAYPEDTGSRERLELSMIFAYGPTASEIREYLRPSDVTIIYLLGGITGPRWEARNIDLQFEVTETSDMEGTFRGNFSAEFCYHKEVYADPDEESCQAASGAFDTRLVIEGDT